MRFRDMTKRDFAHQRAGPSHELLFSLWISGRRFFYRCLIHLGRGWRRFSSEQCVNGRFNVFVLGTAVHLLRQNPRPSWKAELLLRASARLLGLRAHRLRTSLRLSELGQRRAPLGSGCLRGDTASGGSFATKRGGYLGRGNATCLACKHPI
jgi:hypothetical protein